MCNIYGCKQGQTFSKYSGYSKLTENNKVYYSEDFVIKSDYFPYRILDFERIDKLNRELRDANKKYHYILVNMVIMNFLKFTMLITLN